MQQHLRCPESRQSVRRSDIDHPWQRDTCGERGDGETGQCRSGGLTQERRYIAGKLAASPQSVAD